MPATIDRTDRTRSLAAPTPDPDESEELDRRELLLDEFTWLLTSAVAGPGDRRYRKARKHAREFAALGVALLEWDLEREPSSEQSGDLCAYFDACVRNARDRKR